MATTGRTTTRSRSGADRERWDDPDLQGVWNVAAGTPLERPEALAGTGFSQTKNWPGRPRRKKSARAQSPRHTASLTDLRRKRNDFWFDKREASLTRRTSLIVDPPDGKLPPLTPEAARQTPAVADELHKTDGPEDGGSRRALIHGLPNDASSNSPR
jgi:hypothetical protein